MSIATSGAAITLLAEYSANGSGILRDGTNAPFWNIRFVYNAVVDAKLQYYDLHEAMEPLSPVRVGVTSGQVSFPGSLLGGFDGSFIALLPEAVHSPWIDDVHDGEWCNIQLRGWNWRTGSRSFPDHRRRASNLAQP
jgi:hypothetical protein